jgi:steroid delta-isomerase-like uncharacterized protein
LSRDPRLLVQHFYDALNRRDLNALDGIVSADMVHHSLPIGAGRDAFIRMLVEFHEGFPDLFHTLEDVVVEGDRIAVRTMTTGTHLRPFLGHAPTGRSFSAPALSLYRIEGGLIRDVWDVFDTLSMLQQIGLYSPASDSTGKSSTSESLPIANPQPSGPGPGRRPPGPSEEVSLADIRSDPLSFLRGLVGEYGDFVRYVCNGRETILLNRPEAIRHVLHDRESNYSKLRTPDLLLLKPMLGDGLLTTVGPTWKQDRQWLQPVFTPRRMELAADLMVQVVDEMLERWRTRPDPEAPVDIVREMSRLTLEIAARALFSTDFASHSESFGEAMDVLNESMGHAQPDNPDVQQQFRAALLVIRRTILQAILSRRFYDPGKDDLLASLLRSQCEHGDSDQHVLDQAVTILLAGHETTAKALSWAIALLDRNPAALARLLKELSNHLDTRRPVADDLRSLRYTRAVIDEALRLYPPIWMLTRTALEDDQIAGYAIPTGALVAISPYLIHRHPNLWELPDQFVPDRFLADEGPTQAYRYLPFGHGPRHCIGKFFAMLEMPLVLATVYPQFALTSLPDHNLEAEALVTLRPRNGLHMIARPRRLDSLVASATNGLSSGSIAS